MFVKDETGNPTGSYKDRGSAVALAWLAARSKPAAEPARAVGTVSYGNMAMSTAAHAASLGRECVVLVPEGTPSVRLSLIEQYGPTVLQVSGAYGQLYHDVLHLDRELPVEFLLSDPPARVSGYRTCAFEIADPGRSGPANIPDAVVLPASSGGFASGIWHGFRDLRRAGLLEELPRIYLVQTAAADPITRAFETGAETVSAVEEGGETIATSIGNPDPPSGTVALTAARETGGAVLSVTDDELRTATRQFAERGGFCVEPASAAPLAGLGRLADRGAVGPDEDVVVIPTGTGFKELGVTETGAVGDAADAVETVDRGSVRDRLGDLLAH